MTRCEWRRDLLLASGSHAGGIRTFEAAVLGLHPWLRISLEHFNHPFVDPAEYFQARITIRAATLDTRGELRQLNPIAYLDWHQDEVLHWTRDNYHELQTLAPALHFSAACFDTAGRMYLRVRALPAVPMDRATFDQITAELSVRALQPMPFGPTPPSYFYLDNP